ncbi:hypothetical protein EGW08_004556 [Elysia chlorotica]|uniref:protein-disulfide reductase n=1 Tax=Elysia chlorotica TaxID=188477 RepID=A0A3S0ZVG1_ELYCH|nr:hypothetical protein EGW08_004556 [Elysia chlorotica]
MSALEQLFGSELISDVNGTKVSTQSLADKDLIAHWCPPCRGFTPQLASCYKAIKDAGKSFEIVFVSFDRDDASFKEYFGEMPWLSLPFDSDKKPKRSPCVIGTDSLQFDTAEALMMYCMYWVFSHHCLFIVVILSFVQRCQFCPAKCTCALPDDYETTLTLIVNCSYRNLTSFPSLFDVDLWADKLGREPSTSVAQPTGEWKQVSISLAEQNYYSANNTTVASRGEKRGSHGCSNGHIFRSLTGGKFWNTYIWDLCMGTCVKFLNNTFAFSRLKGLSITGSESEYETQNVFNENTRVCNLDANRLPRTLRTLSIINCGTVVLNWVPQEDLPLELEELTLVGLRLRGPPLLAVTLMKSSLKHLDLSQNYIASLWHDRETTETETRLSADCRLETLNLSHNRISTVGHGTFQKCTRLKNLDLSHNPLLKLTLTESGIFSEVSPFLTIDISSTWIRSLQTISPKRVYAVTAFHAELQCDCEILAQDIVDFLRHGKIIQGTCREKNKSQAKTFKELLQDCFGVEMLHDHCHNNGTDTSDSESKTSQCTKSLLHFSPLSCLVCALAGIIYGTLLFAVLFNSWNSLLVKCTLK